MFGTLLFRALNSYSFVMPNVADIDHYIKLFLPVYYLNKCSIKCSVVVFSIVLLKCIFTILFFLKILISGNTLTRKNFQTNFYFCLSKNFSYCIYFYNYVN